MSGRVERVAGWGRHPVIDTTLHTPANVTQLAEMANGFSDLIARGNGRSYGDASLNPAATVATLGLDRFDSFDPETGLLVCEAGLLLSELIDVMLPRGWFPPVTPGTKLVTIGGMIASDVHGKNHHGAGSFCDHVEWLDLALGDGRVLRCCTTEHADLFAATCGGMGLTGVILRACVRMIRVETAAIRQRTIRAPTLRHAIEVFEASLDWTYSVAWIDCLASGRDLGRSAVLLGEHAALAELPADRRFAPLRRPRRKSRRVPLDLPQVALNRLSVSLFNGAIHAGYRPGDALVDLEPYFYPLDVIHDWNRIYGRRGFVQYQCVLPLAASEAGMTELLTSIAAAGAGSFLAVLKRLGRQSFGLLSFPMEGYTLALDFPANTANLTLLDRLDAITLAHGGRVYLAKDAQTTPRAFAAGYPRLTEFRDIRRRYGLDQRFTSLMSHRLEI